MDASKLKILLVNHSDSRGGAAVVSRRLMEALCASGADARMLVVHKDGDSPRIDRPAGKLKLALPFLAEHADIFRCNGFDRGTLFRISTGAFGTSLLRHPWFEKADAVILNWVNQGMLSLRQIESIARQKPVVWVMHDMWNLTGVCHYTEGCTGYTSGCAHCPLVPKSSLAAKVFARKKRLYENSSIHFVAVSHRLEQMCRRSPLMEKAPITVIPNPFPLSRFPVEPALSRKDLGLPESQKLIVMGAARLDDPVKNLPLAIEALNLLDRSDATPVFYGNLRNPEILRDLRANHLWTGPIHNEKHLQSLMAHADVVLSTSVWETLPGTLIEGISCGAAAAATSNGGQSDIVDPGITGYLIPTPADSPNGPQNPSPHEVARAIDSALKLPQDAESRKKRHALMAAKFDSRAVAARYLKLIDHLVTHR